MIYFLYPNTRFISYSYKKKYAQNYWKLTTHFDVIKPKFTYRPEKYLISRGRKYKINNIVVQKILVKRSVSISCPLWAINGCNVNLEYK